MNNKFCTKCQQDLPLDCFYPLRTGKRQFGWCKKCNGERNKTKYQSNKYYFKEKAKRNIQNYKNRVILLLEKYKFKECPDCHQTYPLVCIDFDHKSGTKKLFNIAHGINKHYSLIRLEQEIKKCESVCSNCHRIRTAQRREMSNGLLDKRLSRLPAKQISRVRLTHKPHINI